MRSALVKDGIVQEIVMTGPGYKPPPDMTVIPAEKANKGDAHNGEKFVSAPIPIPPKEELIIYAWARRAFIAQAGLRVNVAAPGEKEKMVLFPSGQEERSILDEMAHLAALDRTYVAQWVHSSHGTLTLSADQILDIRLKMARKIADTHGQLSATLEAINSGELKTIQEVRDYIECPACQCKAEAAKVRALR